MNTFTRIRPNVTTLCAGGGIIVVSLIWFFAYFGLAIPITDEYILLFTAEIPQRISSIILLLAMGILAFGIRGEPGIVGRSVIGKIALLVFGLGTDAVVPALVGVLARNLSQNTLTIEGYFELNFAYGLIIIASGVVAAIVVVRANILHGFARWALVPVVVCYGFAMGLSWIPELEAVYVAAGTELLRPASLIVLGFTYLLQGQSAAIHHRLQIINEKW